MASVYFARFQAARLHMKKMCQFFSITCSISHSHQQNVWDVLLVIRGAATKISAQGPATGSEEYEGASVRSARAGTIELMLKSYENWGAEEGIWRAWGCRRGYLASLGVPHSPRHPRWRRRCL